MLKNILQDNSFAEKGADFVFAQSHQYLKDLIKVLDDQIDKRLVQTFFGLFIVILTFRNRAMGLLLSELGGYICGFNHAPAGTKRISNLLRSPKWESSVVDNFLFNKGQERIKQLQASGKRPLALWDDSVVEKPESWFAQGLCSVGSSKGKRLTKIKRGFYRPPASRICVPGFHWTAVVISATGQIPSVWKMSWWSTRGKFKELGSNIVYRMLGQMHQKVGRAVLNIFDRGYASATMLEWLFKFEQDFVIRWKTTHLLINEAQQSRKTYLLARSCKAQASQLVWDKERKHLKRVSIAWTAVWHPEFPENPLALVIVRDKKNFNAPMYLLTSLPIQNTQQAWEVCFAYMHRWNIEQAFRFGKSELAMESPRLWFWENRLKLLAIVALVYDFLMRILRNWISAALILINKWCHRTGNRYRSASIPVYRLRMAIANCLMHAILQNSG